MCTAGVDFDFEKLGIRSNYRTTTFVIAHYIDKSAREREHYLEHGTCILLVTSTVASTFYFSPSSLPSSPSVPPSPSLSSPSCSSVTSRRRHQNPSHAGSVLSFPPACHTEARSANTSSASCISPTTCSMSDYRPKSSGGRCAYVSSRIVYSTHS